MLRKPRLSSLLATRSGWALVLGTSLIVVVAVAMALFGPYRGSEPAASVKHGRLPLSASRLWEPDAGRLG